MVIAIKKSRTFAGWGPSIDQSGKFIETSKLSRRRDCHLRSVSDDIHQRIFILKFFGGVGGVISGEVFR
jgi:hypothetical protein